MSLIGASTSELLSRLERGDLSTVEVVKTHLNRIHECDPQVQSFLSFHDDEAIARAEEIDQRRVQGTKLGPLAGLPIAVKDVLCMKGKPTTCASRMLESYHPPYDAHVVEQLHKADAIILGKTNMDEFAMGSSTENSAFRSTRNPWNLQCTPGGSSGGSAACVAAQMTPFSIGSDTGGSIRQPASYCGVVGMKPTYGRVSRYGLVAFASSLDQIGPFANDVQGSALLLESIAGYDQRDSTSLNVPVPAYTRTLENGWENLKIGIVKEHYQEGLDPQVEQAVQDALQVYRSLGAEIKEISLPHAKYSVATYYIIAPSEASSNLARYDGVHYGYRSDHFDNMIDMYASSRGEAFGNEVKRRIMLGTFALSSGYADQYYVKALKIRRLIRNDYDEAFQHVDVIAGPVTPTAAFKLGEKTENPLEMYLTDIYTIGTNLAGLPGISIPAGMTKQGLPIGLHIQAPPLEEDRLFRVARLFERETDWHTKRPAS